MTASGQRLNWMAPSAVECEIEAGGTSLVLRGAVSERSDEMNTGHSRWRQPIFF